MPTSIDRLYEAGSERYNLGDFDVFSQKMTNPQSRQKFYTALSEHYDLGDFETFTDKVIGASLPSGDEPLDQLEARPGYVEPEDGNGDGQQPQPQPQAEAEETPQQMVGQFVQDSIANDPFLADLNDMVDSELFAVPESTGITAQPDIAPEPEPVQEPVQEPEPVQAGMASDVGLPKTKDDTGDLFGQGLQNLIRAGAGIFDYAQHLNRAAEKYGLDKDITGKKYVAPDYSVISETIRAAVDEMDVEQPTGKYAESPEKLREYLTDPKRFIHLTATNAPTTAALAVLYTVAPATAVMTMNTIEGGQTAQTIKEYEKETGRKLDSHQATIAPFVVGAINAALEKAGIETILETSGAWKGVRDAVKKVLFSALVEGGTEGAQEVNQVVSEILTDQGLDPMWADRIVANTVAGLGSGGGLTAAGGATTTMYEGAAERKEARLRSKTYMDDVRKTVAADIAKEVDQARQPFTKDLGPEVEAELAAEEAPAVEEVVKEPVAEPATEFDEDIEGILEGLPEEEEIVEPTPAMAEGEIVPEVAPVEEKVAEKGQVPATAFEETRAEREGIEVIPEDVIAKEVEAVREERRVANVDVEIERRLVEEEPIMELDADQVSFVNETVRNLGSIEAVAERYPSDDATDRYARQRAEREFGAEMKAPAEPVSAEPVSEVEEMKAKPVEIEGLIFASSGRPYKTKGAAQRKANVLGEGYEVVPYEGAFAVQKVTPTAPAKKLTPEEQAKVDKDLDAYEKDRDEDIPFATKSVRPAGEPGMGVIDLERALGPVKGKYHIPIKIVGGIEDLPTRLRAAAEATQRKAPRKKAKIVSGFYDRGTAYLVGAGIRNEAEAIQVMSHEVVGHAGIEGLLGAEGFTGFLKNLQGDKYISPMIRRMARERGIAVNEAAKEWFADRAEGKNFETLPDNIAKRVIFWFKKWLRKMFGAKVSFSIPEMDNLLRRSYQYAISPDAGRTAAEGEIAFKTQNVRVTLTELQDVYKAIDDLPPVRTGKPTTALMQRLQAKKAELEDRLSEMGGGVSFRTRPVEGTRLQKKLAALESGLPAEGKDEMVKRRMSTLIREQIKAVKAGHLIGGRDMKESLSEIKRFILVYARKHLPKEGITRGQVKPLLTALAQASKPEDVSSAYARIDKITRTVTSKKLVADIDKLLKRYKPKKKDGKIVGKIIADAHREVANITAIVKMKPDEVHAEIERVLKGMNSRAVGAEDASGGEPTEAEAELLYRLDKFGDLKNKTPAQLEAAIEELQSIISTGRTKLQEKNAARKEIMEAVKDRTLDFMSKGKGILTEEQVAAIGGPKKEGALRKYFQAQLTFEYLLDELSRNEKGAAPLRGTLNNFFMPKVHGARNAESKGVREGMQMFQDKLGEIFGTTKPSDLMKIGTAHTIPEPVGVTVEQDGRPVPLVLSQEQAYKLWQAWQDPTLAETFEKMGYTQETMDAIEKFIDPKVKQWAEWQLYEFYPQYYATVNAVFRERYNVDLPYNPTYTPISRRYEGSDKQDDQLLTDNTAQFSSVLNNHLKGRVKNTRALKLLGGDNALIRHLIEMEHFKAWAEPMRDLRSYFGDERVRTVIKQNFGPHLMRKIDDFVNDFARGGVDPKLVVDFLDRRRKNFTTAVLGLNFTLVPKQLGSIPAYAADIPMADYVTGTLDFLRSPKDKIKILMQSELLKARYELGWDRDVALMLQRTAQQQLAGKQAKMSKYMFPTKVGDRAAILLGGWSVYKFHLDKAKAEGKSEKEAKDTAMYEFEASTSRSQQSGNLEDLPSIMRGGSWARLFTMFQTAPAAYFRMEASAILNLKRGRGSKAEQTKRLAIAHFILPTLFQFIANGFRWRDEDQLRAAILGPLNGLLIVGKWLETGVQVAVSKAMGARSYFFGIGSNPVFETLDEAKRLVNSAGNLAADGTIDWKDVGKVLDGLLKVASKVTGHPYAAPSRMVAGALDVVTGKRVEPLKFAGYSKFALGRENLRQELLGSLEEYSEVPKGEQDTRVLNQLEGEIEDYNKEAHRNNEPLIKKSEVIRLKRSPRQVAAQLVYDSGSRVLSGKSVKAFKRKIGLALESGEIKQELYDTWIDRFETNQELQKKLKQGYYEQGLEVPRRGRAPAGAPRPQQPPRPPGPGR